MSKYILNWYGSKIPSKFPFRIIKEILKDCFDFLFVRPLAPSLLFLIRTVHDQLCPFCMIHKAEWHNSMTRSRTMASEHAYEQYNNKKRDHQALSSDFYLMICKQTESGRYITSKLEAVLKKHSKIIKLLRN